MMHYVHTDPLGSLNCLTNENGTIEQELSFNAWSLSDCWRSNRRDPDTWQNLTATPSGLITDRGFTGHLHLDGFKLINTNGRIYDPVLGRFLSPDNFVQDAGSTQHYNRYSYCGNNPLIYTDPSGYIRIPQTPAYDNGNDNPGGASGSGDYSIFGKYGTIFPYGLDCGAGPGMLSSGPSGMLGYYYDYNSGTYIDRVTGEVVSSNFAINSTVNRLISEGVDVYRGTMPLAKAMSIDWLEPCSKSNAGGYVADANGAYLVVTATGNGRLLTYLLNAFSGNSSVSDEVSSGQGGGILDK